MLNKDAPNTKSKIVTMDFMFIGSVSLSRRMG